MKTTLGVEERERERGLGLRNVVTREFNEHFFQLKSLHSVHYEAAAAEAEAEHASMESTPPAEKSNCGLEWNERD